METLFGIEIEYLYVAGALLAVAAILTHLVKSRQEAKIRDSLEYKLKVAEENERRKEEWRKQWEDKDGSV